MPIPLTQLAGDIDPSNTVLFFGSGSSIPSKAPSVDQIIKCIASDFGLGSTDYSLAEISGIAEAKSQSRRKLITSIRKLFEGLRPAGGVSNISLYDWKSLFTTNYDHLIEDAYEDREKDLRVYSSDFDFGLTEKPRATKLFKLHGTIEKDVSDGVNSRIILTEADYDLTEEYRKALYDQLRASLAGSHLIIIGHSLADPHIKEVVSRAARINSETMGTGRITLLLYSHDPDRALLFEARGIEVCFGGIDEFFAELARKNSNEPVPAVTDRILDNHPELNAITVDVDQAADPRGADVSAMFNGRPASYADIASGLTFQRSKTATIDDYLAEEGRLCAVITGASGVGKTTLARQIAMRARSRGVKCFEHPPDQPFVADEWFKVAETLRKKGEEGLLTIDEAYTHLFEINDLVDRLVSGDNGHLRLLMISPRNQWSPRVKSPGIYTYGKEWLICQLENDEIDRLLHLVDTNDRIRPLIEDSFEGFSKNERRRRLIERCEKDFFVCLKNIFASEVIDDIILREFATIPAPYEDIYRHVAAMETAGIRVHRQLIIRLLGIPALDVMNALTNLRDIVHEYEVDPREGIYGWKCRHQVIASIVARYKYYDLERRIGLFDKVIDCISPAFDIEIRTIRELCNVENGLPSLPDINVQNRLLRKMISIAPGERVPRHRLIRNLIAEGEFEKAETEIRIFKKDFGYDGPVHRYRIDLTVARAVRSDGLLEEDRIVILEQAQEIAVSSVERFPNNKNILRSYANLGVEYYRRTGEYNIFDDATNKLKEAEERTGEPEISKLIRLFERRIQGQTLEMEDLDRDA
ncbi:SIR2 family protein [Roseibium alexandrii]